MLAQSLCCPHCHSPLTLQNKSLSCENNHCFDQAKQGYFNLLPSNQKKSKHPGDNAEMVLARNKFLETNIYAPISDALNHLCSDMLTKQKHNSAPKILDIGCGEGYYTSRLSDSMTQTAPEIIGLDISKDAVKFAARRNSDITWIVASGNQVPVQKHSQDLITCLFTRLMPEGMANSLNPDGALVTITTGKEHLIEMREILYPQVKEQVMDPSSHLSSHFMPDEEQVVKYTHTLTSSQQIADLLAMTPHQWRAPEQGRTTLLERDVLEITIDVNIQTFKPKAATPQED